MKEAAIITQRHRVALLVACWVLTTIGVGAISSSGRPDPSAWLFLGDRGKAGHSPWLFVVSMDLPLILGTAGAFLASERIHNERLAVGLVLLSFVWTTPAWYLGGYIPLPYTWYIYDWVFESGRGFTAIFKDYWVHPGRTVFLMAVNLFVATALAWFVAGRMVRVSRRVCEGWRRNANWLLVFPVFLGALAVFHVFFFVIVVFVLGRAGVFPPARG